MSLFFYIQLQYSVPVLKGGKISNILVSSFGRLTHLWNTAADVYNEINRSSSDLLFDLSDGAGVGGCGFGFGGTLSGKHFAIMDNFFYYQKRAFLSHTPRRP
jgi:hypothetical protein